MGLRLVFGFLKRKQVVTDINSPLSHLGQRTLLSLYPVMCNEDDPQEIQKAISEIQQYLKSLSRRTQIELELALAFLNQGTLLWGYFSPFPHLNKEQKIKFIHQLANGPRLMAPIFLGLKEVCFLGYYSLEKNCHKIDGYTTMVPFSGDPEPEFNRVYEQLKAKS